MSKENGFFCENPEHGHISEMDAVECYGRDIIERALQDINWMLNNREFLNAHVFDYLEIDND